MNTPPHANTYLSPEHIDHGAWLGQAKSVFYSNGRANRMSLDAMEQMLKLVQEKHDARSQKVDAIRLYAENSAALIYLAGAGSDNHTLLLLQLEAETAMRDSLAMAITGIERAIEWRKANPTQG